MTVDRLLATLPERERRIVELRFYGEMTQTEIANEVGVSQMHVSRLLRKALMELSNRLEPLPSSSSSG
jgi:RNA polymerase sigma-B factor